MLFEDEFMRKHIIVYFRFVNFFTTPMDTTVYRMCGLWIYAL